MDRMEIYLRWYLYISITAFFHFLSKSKGNQRFTCIEVKLIGQVMTLVDDTGESCLQQPGRGHPRFPGGRGAFQRGPRPSGNLIVIQTVPMEGDPEPTQHLPTAGLPGPRAPPSDGPTALLRPQDKWTAQKTTKPKRMSQLTQCIIPAIVFKS